MTRVVPVPRGDPETPALDADESDGFPFQERACVLCSGRLFWKLLWNGRGSFPVISVLENLTQTTLASYFQQISEHILKKYMHF